MSTNEEQACGACGEPASAHPVDLATGNRKCGYRKLAFRIAGMPKRPEPTHEQARALGRREAIGERIQENLEHRKALFIAGQAADADCAEWDRLGKNALVDLDAITYGLGTCEAFLPRELSDSLGRRWHLILDKAAETPGKFMIFREANDALTEPSEALLEALRGSRVSLPESMAEILKNREAQLSEALGVSNVEPMGWAGLIAHAACLRRGDQAAQLASLNEKARLEGEVDSLRAALDEVNTAHHAAVARAGNLHGSFLEVAKALFPDALDEIERVSTEDATLNMIGRVGHLRREASAEVAIEIRDRSLALCEALGVDPATPWQDLIAIAKATVIRRDEAIAKREKPARLFGCTEKNLMDLAYALGCERVTMSNVAEAMIATATSLKKGAEAFREDQKKLVVRHRHELCEALGKEPSSKEWSDLLDVVRELKKHAELQRLGLAGALEAGTHRSFEELVKLVEHDRAMWKASEARTAHLVRTERTAWRQLSELRAEHNNALSTIAELKKAVLEESGQVEVQPKVTPRVVDPTARDHAREEHHKRIERVFGKAPTGAAPGSIDRTITIQLDPGDRGVRDPEELRRIFVEAFDQAQRNLREPFVPAGTAVVDAKGLRELKARVDVLVDESAGHDAASQRNHERIVQLADSLRAERERVSGTEHAMTNLAKNIDSRISDVSGIASEARSLAVSMVDRISKLEGWRKRFSDRVRGLVGGAAD